MGKEGGFRKRIGKILLVIACVIGLAVGSVCLMMKKQVRKAAALSNTNNALAD